MALPKDKKLIGIIYVYEDGSEYECDGRNSVNNFQRNIDKASSLWVAHGFYFEGVEWKKLK